MGNPPEKRRGALAIGAYVPAVARAAFESKGFPSVAVLSDWPAIIGAERLIWPRDAGRDGGNSNSHGTTHRKGGATLVVRVEGPRALELQHMAQQLMERVNIYFGYRAVCELRLVQGPVHRPETPHTQIDVPVRESPELNADIEDDGLRAALERLGTHRRD